MKMTLKRVLIFLSLVLMFGLMLQQCWQSKTASEKWLYFFEGTARDYAGEVLGPGRGTDVPIPSELSSNSIEVYESFVTFSPKQDPALVLAFSPGGEPAEGDATRSWSSIGDGWYVLANPSQSAE